MSGLTLLHEVTSKSISNGKVVMNEEVITSGSKGLKIKFYHKEGDKKEKITIIKTGSDEYTIITVKNDDKSTETVTQSELFSRIEKSKTLKFAKEFIKEIESASISQRGGKKRSKSKKSKKSKKTKRSKRSKSSRRH